MSQKKTKTLDREEIKENMVNLGQKIENGELETVEVIEKVYDLFLEELEETKKLSNELKVKDRIIMYLKEQVQELKEKYEKEKELKLLAMENHDEMLKAFNQNTDLFEKLRKDNMELLTREHQRLVLEHAQLSANDNNNIEGKEEEFNDIVMSGNDNDNEDDK